MIIKNDIVYPSNLSETFRSFLKGLLSKVPEERFTWEEIKNHKFIQKTESELKEEE